MIARNSSFAYIRRTVDIKLVGRELGVRYVVEGSIRVSGSKLRVTVQLIDAESGYQLWGERYDRELAHVFAMRFHAAATLDPNYAHAHANIAWTIVCETFLEAPGVALDDAWSHGVFAQLLFLRREDDRSEVHFNRALALNPNDADVAAVFANILVYWGRWREALEWIETAKRLNPFPPNLYHWYHALALYAGHRHRDAIGVLKQARSLHCWSHGLLAACYARIGMQGEARSQLKCFIKERHPELKQNGEPVPLNDLDLARTRADRYRKPGDRVHFVDGLRKAGLSTTSTHQSRKS